ncbi:MAG: hypothetical protein JWO38_6260 [Gemmataceae bacterium]|nr:hypothetical protein [Gemmataceae bacterium]
MFRRLLVAAFASIAALVTAAPASAGLLPVQIQVTPEGGNFQWTYAIVLPSSSQLQSGDYFTIYDFGGLVPGTLQAPAGWTAAVSNTGPTPSRLNPEDSPSTPNLTFTYTGQTINTGQIGLGNFWAVSQYQIATDSFFTAQTQRTSDGKTDNNITETSVPVPVAPPPPVPEPATLALAGLGLPLVGFARLLRKK